MEKNKQEIKLTIADKILLGALKCIENDPKKPFTFEELVLATWHLDKITFGMRGFEEKYPDSHKLHAHVFGGTALISKGYLRQEKNGFLFLTDAGIARSMTLSEVKISTPPRLSKHLQYSVLKILDHPTFIKWLEDPSTPKDFRGVGQFWGIGPGTPPKAVSGRIKNIERTLQEILNFLDNNKLDCLREERVKGKILFERKDIERCLEFIKDMKSRFKKELNILDPEGKY